MFVIVLNQPHFFLTVSDKPTTFLVFYASAELIYITCTYRRIGMSGVRSNMVAL